MRRTGIAFRLETLATAAALASAHGCRGADGVLGVAVLGLKIFAGAVVAVLVFLPLMASLTTIRAAVRRYLGSRDGER